MTVLEGHQVGSSYLCLTEKRAIKLQAAIKQLLRGDDVEVTRESTAFFFWRVEVWRWHPIKQDTPQTPDHREAA